MALAHGDGEIDRQTRRGMALMVGAAFVMPCLDAIAKILGQSISPAQIGFMRFTLQAFMLTAGFAILGRTILSKNMRRAAPKLALAGAFMASATLLLFWGLQTLPLANAIVLLFVAPLFLTLFAAFVLGEQVGVHRFGAVVVGFIGALIVIRPNFLLFGWSAILPLLAAACFAGLMATLRSVSFGLDGFRIQLACTAFGAIFLGVALLVGTAAGVEVIAFTVPTIDILPLIILLTVIGIVGQAMMTFAAKFAEASLIAPFQYIEIIAATVLGYVLFNEFPDELTWLGTAVILSAGLYTIHRERRRQRVRATEVPLA
ncbi:MAG: DMT family transporter [Pseudomonadota bacterium]